MRGRVAHIPSRRGLVVALVVLIAVAVIAIAPTDRSGAAARVSSAPVGGGSDAWVPIARPSAIAVMVPRDPFKTRAMRRFLASRSGNITAAVYDVDANTTFIYHPDDREQTASIVKANILALLLAQEQREGEPLSAGDEAVATGMIEESDNDDATTLWDEEGGAPAVAAFDRRLRMTQTTPSDAWGLTTTDPRDQLRLLEHIALPNHVLRRSYRRVELYLMEHVSSEDYWGITAGPGPGVTVAVKNGWLPVEGGWQINSIGMVRGHGRFYLIAVMTNGNASEGDGIDTIEGISRLVYAGLRNHSVPIPRGTTGPSGVSGPSGSSSTAGASGSTAVSGASGPTGTS
jgi:hypothetical protein